VNELFGYSLTQFIMVSPEVFQDLHWRYWQALWPWFCVFILCNGLVFFKQYCRLFFCYVSLSWLFIAWVYFKQYLSEVHTFAFIIAALFILQAAALALVKVVYFKPFVLDESIKIRRVIRRAGLLIYGMSALAPLSLILENSKGTLLLFGWGAEQTALGTIGLIVYSYNQKRDLLLVIIPLLWLSFYTLFL